MNDNEKINQIMDFAGSDTNETRAAEILERMDKVEAAVENIADMDDRLWSAIVSDACGESSWNQQALIEIVALAGGVESCTIDWAEAAVQHAENGDKPEDLERGDLCPEIYGFYDGLLWDREKIIEAAFRDYPKASIEELEAAFTDWANTPISRRSSCLSI